MLLMKLGYRNLWRNRRRTVLTMSAMGVATALVILILGIYDGMLWDMIDSATEMYHGHVKITNEDYPERHQLYQTIPQDGVAESVRSDPRVIGAAGRVRGFALLSYGEGADSKTQPAELFGIAPAEEHTVSKIDERVVEGAYLSGDDTHEIVLGVGLARLLGAKIGGEIVAMGQGADGSIAADLFTVAGIVNTGNSTRDAALAVVGRTTLQHLLVLDGRLHEVAVSMHRPLEASAWAAEYQEKLPGVAVQPWNKFLPQIGAILDIWDAMKFIFALVFYFAVILVTVNTMYMAFFERTREFGIMNAIGLKLRRMSLMIVLEGMLMSSIAGLAGGAVGIGLSFILRDHPIDLSGVMSEITYAETAMQPQIRTYPALNNMLYPILMIIALGCLISLLPARKLRRLQPVDVIREV